MAKATEVVVSVEEVASYFAELEDPRSEVNLRHPLVSVVTISVMAVLAGADGPTAIHRWAKLKREFLARVLPLPHGIPSKDVFGRVLAALDPQAFQAGFGAWLARCGPKPRGSPRCRDRHSRSTARRCGVRMLASTASAHCTA